MPAQRTQREHSIQRESADIGARRGTSGRDRGGAVSRLVGAVPAVALITALALASTLVHRLTGDQLLAEATLLVRSGEVMPLHGQLTGLRGGGGPRAPATIPAIRSELSDRDPLSVWNSIVEAAAADAAAAAAAGRPLVAVEVGVHSPRHCLHAAEQGFLTHCFEPSPLSYARLVGSPIVKDASPEVKARVVPHREAAGPSSGGTVPFHSTGGTGDHVGEYDMWKMERRRQDPPSSGESQLDRKKRGEIIEVPTTKLDDFIRDDVEEGEVYLLKVDTQGFEPSIFSGLRESIRSGAIRYVIFEFWPRGMDLMADTPGQCSGRQVPDMLAEAGYELYALGVEAHPKAPLKGGGNIRREAMTRPLNQGTEAYCRWFFDLEGRHPSEKGEEEYKFGYWADFVAVAPGVKLPDEVFRAV